MLLEDVSLTEGQRFRQSEFDQYFGAGATGKAIEIGYDDKSQKYLWLFAKEGGRYDDDIDRHGIAGLATALTYAIARDRGEVTHRTMTDDLGVSPLAAEFIL